MSNNKQVFIKCINYEIYTRYYNKKIFLSFLSVCPFVLGNLCNGWTDIDLYLYFYLRKIMTYFS